MIADPTSQRGSGRRHVQLATGRLTVDVRSEPVDILDAYCDFAARDNARRGYLFISKVLGKHLPCRPSDMRMAQEALAAQVQLGEGDRAVVLGMAETATGLGYGVFEALYRRFSGHSLLYAHTTRYWRDADALTFEETHSHAPTLCLHAPYTPELAAAERQANVLVLVDDEVSTGRTCANLALAFRVRSPGIERVHVASLCDFSDGAAVRWIAERTALPVTVGALVRGAHRFESCGVHEAYPETHAQPRRFMAPWVSAAFGRGYADEPLLVAESDVAAVIAVLGGHTAPIMVLGTGEFMHAAFVLGAALERAGRAVFVQATTRSPILVGSGIRSKHRVPDHYCEDIPNYLYNFDRERYGEVLICHEGPANPATLQMAAQLRARLIGFEKLGAHALSVR